MSVSFPLDLSGNNPSNLIRDELHTVTEAHFRDFFFIVPNLSPFFVDNFKMTLTVNSVTTLLIEDVHYSFSLPYITGTRVTGKAMYGAITLHNLDMTGIVSITYQTVGGDQVVDRLHVLTFLSDKIYNPRTTIWDIITNVPNAFPPTPHYQDYDQFFGQNELVAKLHEIKQAILTNSTNMSTELRRVFSTIGVALPESYVKRSGDTMLGHLELVPHPTNENHAVTKQYVDTLVNAIMLNYATNAELIRQVNLLVNKSGDTMTGPLILSSNPVQNFQAATKMYVDDLVASVNNQLFDLSNRTVTRGEFEFQMNDLRSRLDEIMIRLYSKPN